MSNVFSPLYVSLASATSAVAIALLFVFFLVVREGRSA